jgi:hypothetical protein
VFSLFREENMDVMGLGGKELFESDEKSFSDGRKRASFSSPNGFGTFATKSTEILCQNRRNIYNDRIASFLAMMGTTKT